jgi:hypothetical protein
MTHWPASPDAISGELPCIPFTMKLRQGLSGISRLPCSRRIQPRRLFPFCQQDSQLRRPVGQSQAQALQIRVVGVDLLFDGSDLAAAFRNSCCPLHFPAMWSE